MAPTDGVLEVVQEQILLHVAPLKAVFEQEAQARQDATSEIGVQIDELVRTLREEAQDREISFTKALSQRPKGEEVLRDISHAAQRFESILQANIENTSNVIEELAARVHRLEEHSRHEEVQSSAASGKKLHSSEFSGPALQNLLNELREMLEDTHSRCREQEAHTLVLSERLDVLLGKAGEEQDGEPPEQLPLSAIVERIDCLASAVSHFESSTQECLERERKEREVLNRMLSQRLAHEVSERMAACAKLSDDVESITLPKLSYMRAPSPAVGTSRANGCFSSGNSVELAPTLLAPTLQEGTFQQQLSSTCSPPQPSPFDTIQFQQDSFVATLSDHPRLDHMNSVSCSSTSRSVGMLPVNTSPRSRQTTSWGHSMHPTSPRRRSPAGNVRSVGTGGPPAPTLRSSASSGFRSSVPMLAGREAGHSSVMRSTSQPQAPPLDRRSPHSGQHVIVATASGGGSSPTTIGRQGGTSFEARMMPEWDGAMSPQLYKGPFRMATVGSVTS